MKNLTILIVEIILSELKLADYFNLDACYRTIYYQNKHFKIELLNEL